MQIRLDQLDDHHFTWTESMRIDTDELSQPDIIRLGEVGCRGAIDETTDGWVLRMTLSYPQTLNCVRCLDPVDASVELETALLLVPRDSGEFADDSTDEQKLDREDLGVQVLTEPEIETRELAVEQMQLAIPMKPLCREDCKGLCGTCGQNLNEGHCDCELETDPRWAALEELKNVH